VNEIELFSVYGKIGLDDRDFSRGIDQAENQGRGFAASMGKMAAGVAKAGAAVGAAVMGIGVAAINVGGQFQQMGNSIQAQTGQTADDVGVTKMAIRDLALETGRFSADELVLGLYGVSRAGQTSEHQLMLVERATRLADSSGNSFATSISNLDALMVKFGNETLEGATKFTNMFATAQGVAGVANASLLEGLQRAAGIVNNAGLAYDFTAAALTRAYQGGMSMQVAATGLSTIFGDMLDVTSNVRGVMEGLGVAIVRNADGSIDYQQSLSDLMEVMRGLDYDTRAATIAQIGWTGSAANMFNVLKNETQYVDELAASFRYGMETGEDYERVMAAIEARTGGLINQFGAFQAAGRDVLKTIFELIETPLGESFSKAADEARNLAVRLREGDLYPYVRQLADAITDIVSRVTDFAVAAAPVVLQWLPRLANAVTGLLNVAVPLAPAIMGIVAATRLYNAAARNKKSVIDPTIQAIRSLTGAKVTQKLATEAATAATVASEKATKAKTLAVSLAAKAETAAGKATAARMTAITIQTQAISMGLSAEAARKLAATATATADTLAAAAIKARNDATRAQTLLSGLQTKADVAQTVAATSTAAAKGLATKAQLALNAAWKANPIGLVVAGLAGLIGLLTTITTAGRRTSESVRDLSQETDRLIASSDRLSDSIRRSAEAHQDRVRAVNSDADAAREMSRMLFVLSDAEGNSAASREEMLMLTRGLTEAMPELLNYIDEETGLLTLSAEAMERRIEAMAKQTMVDEMQARGIEILREKASANIELSMLEAQRLELEAKHQELVRSGAWDVQLSGASAYQRQIAELNPKIQEQADNLANANEAWERLSEFIAANVRAHNTLLNAMERAAAQGAAATSQLNIQGTALGDLTRAAVRLSTAQRDQEAIGRLSIQTINELTEAGFEQTLQLNQETGSVTLNEEAYIYLVKAKINEQIVSAQTRRGELINALNSERHEVLGTAQAYIVLAASRAAEAASAAAEVASINNTIADFERLKSSISQTTNEIRNSAGASGAASGAASRASVNAAAEAFTQITDYIGRRRHFEEITAAEIVEIWEKSLDNFAEGTEERDRAERELFTARRNLESELYDLRRENFRNEIHMIDQRREHFGLSINDEIALLYDLRNTYADNAVKIEEIDRARLAAYTRMTDAQVNALNRMEAAEERFQQQLERTTQSIFNQFRLFPQLATTEEQRAATAESARQRVIDIEERLQAVRESTSEDFERLASEETRLLQEQSAAREALREAEIAASKTQAQLLIENARVQLEEARNFSYNLIALAARGIDETMLASKTQEQIAIMANMTDSELKEFAAIWDEGFALAREMAIRELQGMREEVDAEIQELYEELNALVSQESPKVGDNMIQSIIDKVLLRADDLSEALSSTVSNAMSRANGILGSFSPQGFSIAGDVGAFSNYASAMPYAAPAAQSSQSITYSAPIHVHIGTVNASNPNDVQALSESLGFYANQKLKGLGQ